MNTIYFDNASTAFPKAPGLGEVMCEQLSTFSYNINRGGYSGAYNLGNIVLDTRELLCDFFHGSDLENVVFTSGNTAAINLVLQGILTAGDHVLVSALEHNAVMRPLEALRECGITWDAIPCSTEGIIDCDMIPSLIRKNTKLIFVTHASNVCGTILPIDTIGAICKQYGLLFAVDGAQTAGTHPIHMQEMHIDFLTLPSHKNLLGPQGIGVLLLSHHAAQLIQPSIYGGTGSASDHLTMPTFLPDKLEPGTMNLTGIVGLNHALQYLQSEGINRIAQRKKLLTELFLTSLREIPNIRIVGIPHTQDHNRCSVISLDFLGQDNAEVSYQLESTYGIATRCGMHCAPQAHKALHTYPQGSVRFSLGYFNTESEIETVISAIKSISS